MTTAYDMWKTTPPTDYELPTYGELADERADEIMEDSEKVMQIIYDSGRDHKVADLLVAIAGRPYSSIDNGDVKKLAILVNSIIYREALRWVTEKP